MAKQRVKPKRDLYAEIGVPRDADAKAIRKAFRSKAKQAHPDTGGSAEAFERLQLAHRILTDQRARAEYDKTGSCDEPGPGETEAHALGLIGAAIGQALQATNDIFTVDLRAKMMADIGQSLGEYKSMLAEAERCRKRAEKLVGRFIKKTGGSSATIDGMLRNYVEKYRAMEVRQEESVAIHARALEILRDCDFKADPLPPGAATSETSAIEAVFMRHVRVGAKT